MQAEAELCQAQAKFSLAARYAREAREVWICWAKLAELNFDA